MKANEMSPNLERAQKILESNPSIDLHNHLGFWETKGLGDYQMSWATYFGDDELKSIIQGMIDGKLSCATVSLTSDTPLIDLSQPGNKVRDYDGDEAWDEYQRERKILDEFFETMPIGRAVTIDDIEPINSEGKLALFLSTEGGHMVEKDLGRMEQLYADGIRHFQPVHYVHCALADSQTDPCTFGGLSPLGKESIKEAGRLGMLVDVAHASYESAKQIADLTANPIVLSHTMMKYESLKHGSYFENRPRWISRDYAQLVAATDGVVGTWVVGEPYGVADLDAFVEATLELVDTIGINHVGWGTDYIQKAMPEWFDNFGQFPLLCAKLLDSGFTDQDLIKFIGGNALRVRKIVCGA